MGFVASFVYLLAQTELFHTVIDIAGLAGSLLWLLWTLIMGGYLIRRAKSAPAA